MFDWANSAFPTVIVTFVFGTYFATGVASNSLEGASLWGSALVFSGVIVAIFGPLVCSIADRVMRRKIWLAAFSIICIISTGCLWFVCLIRKNNFVSGSCSYGIRNTIL